MSQTVLTPQVLKENNYAVQAGDLTINFVASDVANGNAFPHTGREILVVNNTDAAAHNFGVSSVADAVGRTDSSLTAYSAPANTVSIIFLDTIPGWRQTGQILLTSASVLLKFAIMRLPG
jgi:hypothetical protein